jgi:Arc/MetJ family transcription regulator
MRINVVIDDELMENAMESSGCRTRKATIESGLRLLVQIASQKKLWKLRGKIDWSGNLEEMRRD